ncbi:hypothetical protein GYA93_19450 [Gordonia desulfuricans]|uniref:Uncharacterized protein n=1 Tax=Gordonia desulfuricans TaxID=89051 RepID=A0A7K3LU18_9ACTN|nr:MULTISPECIES: hypothetical protein [Gordonia]KOY49384.1 hypothetical protein ISGA_10590 [Gordonia sp. NB41Y]NDK91732.1 hypothetical protein [Gordonia desulfuricans]WLP89918.1 hypothetical protein Q9K23_20645 [Gordonia sp. NB41Y]
MGLITWMRIQRMKDPIPGSLRVEVCPQPDTAVHSASYTAYVIGTASAPGVSPRRVQISTTVPSKRCPVARQRVPVMLDKADPTRVVILWKKVPLRARFDR